MIYVRRDAEGHIASISREADDLHTESVDGGNPELQAYLNQIQSENGELVQSDIALVRVLEDVIDLLIDQDLIRFTDLPVAAQGKLLHRRSIRDAYRNLDLLSDRDGDDEII